MTMETTAPDRPLARRVLPGRRGPRVPPPRLGATAFGRARDGGPAAEPSRGILRRHPAAGGNLVDTADGAADGASESFLGTFLREAGVEPPWHP